MTHDRIEYRAGRARRYLLQGSMWAEAAIECEAALALKPTPEQAVDIEQMGGDAYASLVDYHTPLPYLLDVPKFKRALELFDASAIHDQQTGGKYYSDPLHRAGTQRHDNLHAIVSQALAERDGPQRAIEYLTSTITRLSNIPLIECWAELGDLHAKMGHKVHAVTCFQRVIATPRVRLVADDAEDKLRHYAVQRVRELTGRTGCFVATAAFGSDRSYEVLLLRQFRDTVMMSSAVGRFLIHRYYLTSPAIAHRIRGSSWRRCIVRVLLMPIVIVVNHYLRWRRPTPASTCRRAVCRARG